MPKHYTILLDPGHGASNYSPKGHFQRPLMALKDEKALIICGRKRHKFDKLPNYYREDTGTLEITRHCANRLRNLGHSVFITRDLDNDANARLILRERMRGNAWKRKVWPANKWIREYAKDIKSDIFVSIHTNGGKGTGCSAFYADNEDKGKTLGQNILKQLHTQLDLHIRRNKKHRYLMLRKNSGGHACLIECAFHDHPKDLALLISSKKTRTIGYCVAQGIDSYISDLS